MFGLGALHPVLADAHPRSQGDAQSQGQLVGPKGEQPRCREEYPKGRQAAMPTGGKPHQSKDDVARRQRPDHRRNRQQAQEHPEGDGNALAAAKMPKRRKPVAQHRRAEHRRHPEGAGGQEAQPQQHGQGALGQLAEQTQGAHHRAAELIHIGGPGIPIALLGHVHAPQEQRQPPFSDSALRADLRYCST